MCNAFNHSRNCKCGFGKDGLMRYCDFYDDDLNVELSLIANKFYKSSFGSQNLPNYRCKSCGSKVFFFQSSSGGKVLFDEMGKPWPKHNCMGIEYLRKKCALNISISQWLPISGLTATPSLSEGESIFSGVIPNLTYDQNLIDIKFFIEDPILVKEIHIDALATKQLGESIEALVLLDDGRHELHNAEILNIRLYEMEDLSEKKPYKIQPKLL